MDSGHDRNSPDCLTGQKIQKHLGKNVAWSKGKPRFTKIMFPLIKCFPLSHRRAGLADQWIRGQVRGGLNSFYQEVWVAGNELREGFPVQNIALAPASPVISTDTWMTQKMCPSKPRKHKLLCWFMIQTLFPGRIAGPKSTRRYLTVINVKSGTFRLKKKKINDSRNKPRVGGWSWLGRIPPEMIWSFLFDPQGQCKHKQCAVVTETVDPDIGP